MSVFSKEMGKKRSFWFRSNGLVRKMPARLSAFAESLDMTCKSVEPSFIQLGNDLQLVHSDVAELTQRTLETVKLIGGKSDRSALTTVSGLAKESLAGLKVCQTEIADNLNHVYAIVERLRDLPKLCAVVEKIAMSLRVVGLNIDVESTRSIESREMFSIVAQEIKKLSDKVIEVGETIHDDAMTAHYRQISAHGELSEGTNRLRMLTDDAEKTTKDAVHEISQLMKISIKILERAGMHSQEISHQVGEIVVGIQFHDRMRQRVEHIIKALHDVQRLCVQEKSIAKFNCAKAERLGAAYSILGLQAAQLRHMISEIEEIYQKNHTAFEKICKEVERLAHSLSMLGSENASASEASGEATKDPFSPLKSAIEHLQQLLGQGRNMVDQLRGTAAQASETADRLSGHLKHVREISFETHIKALNAIIKAAHLGDKGRTLEVLAQEMKRLTDQSNTFVADVEKILNSIAAVARELQTQIKEKTKKVRTITKADDSLGIGIQEISRSYTQFKAGASDAFQQAEALESSVSQTRAGLGFLNVLADEVAAHLCQLEEMIEILQPWAVQGIENSATETGKLAKRYTMQQERDIHEQVIDQTDDSMGLILTLPAKISGKDFDPAYLARIKESDKKDDLGDNVELF